MLKMKFLFEFGTCFAPPSVRSEGEHDTTRRTEDDCKSLKTLTYTEGDHVTNKSKAKLNRTNSPTGVAQWKPSLCAISEDKIVFVVEAAKKEQRTVRSGEKVAGKGGSKARIRFHDTRNDHSDYHKHSPAQPVFPTFTPAAFFF